MTWIGRWHGGVWHIGRLVCGRIGVVAEVQRTRIPGHFQLRMGGRVVGVRSGGMSHGVRGRIVRHRVGGRRGGGV